MLSLAGVVRRSIGRGPRVTAALQAAPAVSLMPIRWHVPRKKEKKPQRPSLRPKPPTLPLPAPYIELEAKVEWHTDTDAASKVLEQFSDMVSDARFGPEAVRSGSDDPRPMAGLAQREVQVGERLPEPIIDNPTKHLGIDVRPVRHRANSAVGNHPMWGIHGSWQRMLNAAEAKDRVEAEARGDVWVRPDESWKDWHRMNREADEAKKKAKEDALANIVRRDEESIAAFLKPLKLSEFEEKFHSIDHLLATKTVELKKMGLAVRQRKLFLKYTELVRQRIARGLVPFIGFVARKPAPIAAASAAPATPGTPAAPAAAPIAAAAAPAS